MNWNHVSLRQKQESVLFFFVDAAHFVHGAFLGYIWCFLRVFIPSPSGRKRFNVLAALEAVTKEIIKVTNETYINAESVCQLMAEIAKLGLVKPITLILDNARYQKCALVQNYAAALNIELLYLPSYSPHLNLIERLWNFVRKECCIQNIIKSFQILNRLLTVVSEMLTQNTRMNWNLY
jgi:transposase